MYLFFDDPLPTNLGNFVYEESILSHAFFTSLTSESLLYWRLPPGCILVGSTSQSSSFSRSACTKGASVSWRYCDDVGVKVKGQKVRVHRVLATHCFSDHLHISVNSFCCECVASENEVFIFCDKNNKQANQSTIVRMRGCE